MRNCLIDLLAYWLIGWRKLGRAVNSRVSVVGMSVPVSPSEAKRSVPKPTRSVIVGADQGFSGVQKSDCWGSEKRFLRGNKAFFPLRKFPFDCRSPRHPTFHLLK